MSSIDKKPFDENGKKHGEWIIYTNGQIMYRQNYVHGVLHGYNEVYFSDGNLWFRGNWNMGIKVGYWHLYWENRYYLWLI